MLSHTEKIIVRDSHGTTIIIDGKPYKQIAIVLSSNPGIKPDEATGHNRRLVACWKDHDGLAHDNARLYQSLQGEMQGRLKAEQERGEALAALEIICDLASMEWQEPDGSRKGAVDNWGERLYFVSKELIEGARAILAKHRVNHDQE
jgi:hypothetical protein